MKKLKILVFEYITGGGLNKADLPESLAKEGLLMLQTLLNDFARFPDVEVIVMLDPRMAGRIFYNDDSSCSTKSSSEEEGRVRENSQLIQPEQDCHQEFCRLMSLCDAVWPIAPESEGVLQTLCEAVEQSGKTLLTSTASAVAVAGNKWLTYQCLSEHSVATVPTQRLGDFAYTSGEWLLKPFDGVSCEASYIVPNKPEFDNLTASLEKEKYLIQPHIHGEKTSLSCLFKEGQAWLLCANRQHFELINQQYRLTGITVNNLSDTSRYQALAQAIAKAMPDLWGYAGIDLIETAGEILVLEINPRLTTSYVGIYEALGVNCAKAALELLAGNPQLQATRNKAVYLNLTGREIDAR